MCPPKLCPGLVRNRADIPDFNGTYETHLAKIRIADPARWRTRIHGAPGGTSDGEWLITKAQMRPLLRTVLEGGVLWPVLHRKVDPEGCTI